MLQSKRILIFHGGSIGDTLMALPAMLCVRNNFPNATIELFSCPGVNDFSYLNFYENLNLVDSIHHFYIPHVKLKRLYSYGKFFFKALYRFDLVIYLIPWQRNYALDKLFFRIAGIRKFIFQ